MMGGHMEENQVAPANNKWNFKPTDPSPEGNSTAWVGQMKWGELHKEQNCDKQWVVILSRWIWDFLHSNTKDTSLKTLRLKWESQPL